MKVDSVFLLARARWIAFGTGVALAPFCITETAKPQSVAFEKGIETLWQDAASMLLLGAPKPEAATASEEATSRRKAVARKKRTTAWHNAAKSRRRSNQTRQAKVGVVAEVPLPQQKLLATVSTTAPSKEISQRPGSGHSLEPEQRATGGTRSDEVDCKRYIPAAGMTITVPCPF